MSPGAEDRTLLFALLALRTGFVPCEVLLASLRAWVADRAKPLGQVLVERGALAPGDRGPLEALVCRHGERSEDALRTLIALAPLGPLAHEIERIGDPDLSACLARLGECGPAVTEYQGQEGATLAYLPAPDAAPTLAVEEIAETSRGGRPRPDRSGTRYRVLRPHAKGGLGEVFVAFDVELQREVALKEIQGHHADRAGSRARFLLEAKVTGRLEHPGVVPVYGLGTYADGRPFYAMRFIKGDSLHDALQRFHLQYAGKKDAGPRGLELRRLLSRFVDVCNAIAYAHSRGVLHRDLKPDNIMLGAYGETLVVDWGLAKTLGNGSATGASEEALQPLPATDSAPSLFGAIIGTPQYMAPEQAAGRGDSLGPAADVYALGATLYHLLTGKRPFPDDDVTKVLRLVQSGAFPTPRETLAAVPRPLEAVCLKAMALRPEDRYGSAKELAADVERWLADEPVGAWREPPVVRLRRWGRRHRTLVTSACVLCVTVVAALFIGYLMLSQKQALILEVQGEKLEVQGEKLREQKQRVLAQVDALLNAEPEAVPDILEALEPFREQIRPRLREVRAHPVASSAALERQYETRASLALLGDDPAEVAFLRQRLVDPRLDPQEMLLLRDALNAERGRLSAWLWTTVHESRTAAESRFRALVALAAFDPDSEHWGRCGAKVVEHLLLADPVHLGIWTSALQQVRESLTAPLERAFRSRKHPGTGRVAAGLLSQYIERSDQLVDLLADADADQFALLFPRLKQLRSAAVPVLEREVTQQAGDDWPEERRETLARRQANCAVALLRLGHPGRVWPLLKHSAHPDARTYLIHHLGPLKVDVGLLARRLEQEPDVTARRALVLALGDYTPEQLSDHLPPALVPRLLEWYRDHPDAGLHAAIGWLLGSDREGPVPRKFDWKQAAALRRIDSALKGKPPVKGRRWYVNGQGMTMVLLGPATFTMGAPPAEPDYDTDERQHSRRISRTFALAGTEVTVVQFRRFLRDHPEVKHSYPKKHSPDDAGPILNVTWYEAVQFCRWLSEQEGIPAEQMCYPTVAAIEDCKRKGTPLKLPADFLSRTGYRLPTEAEWEYACRAGSSTSRPHGVSAEMLPRYAWDVSNALARAWPVGQKRPNDFGLFDMHGNVAEWCQDEYGDYPRAKEGQPVPDVANSLEVRPESRRVLRGAPFYPRPAPLRSAYRYWHKPSDRFSTIGLRVARTQRSLER